jgi:hypothetical protein
LRNSTRGLLARVSVSRPVSVTRLDVELFQNIKHRRKKQYHREVDGHGHPGEEERGAVGVKGMGPEIGVNMVPAEIEGAPVEHPDEFGAEEKEEHNADEDFLREGPLQSEHNPADCARGNRAEKQIPGGPSDETVSGIKHRIKRAEADYRNMPRDKIERQEKGQGAPEKDYFSVFAYYRFDIIE